VALAVNGKMPLAVGVPVMEPKLSRDRPGSVPLTRVQVYGGTPPLADSKPEYGVPARPGGKLPQFAVREDKTVNVYGLLVPTLQYPK